MKKITNTNSQIIHLEGFGAILVEEQLDGTWQIDLFPRGYSYNKADKIQLETSMKSTGDKYFNYPKSIAEALSKGKLNSEDI